MFVCVFFNHSGDLLTVQLQEKRCHGDRSHCFQSSTGWGRLNSFGLSVRRHFISVLIFEFQKVGCCSWAGRHGNVFCDEVAGAPPARYTRASTLSFPNKNSTVERAEEEETSISCSSYHSPVSQSATNFNI